MPVTIDSLFGLQTMGQSVALFEKPPQPLRLQDSVFGAVEPCDTPIYRFDREDFELALPPFVMGSTSPSKQVKVQDKKVEYINLAHIRLHKVYKSDDLFSSRAPGELSDNAVAEIQKARTSMRNRILLAKERLCAMALRGAITVNSTNFPDTEGSFTITRAVTSLSAQSASWALPATKIISDDLQDWRKELREATGFEARRALFSYLVGTYLLGNTQAIDWIARTQKGVGAFEMAQLGSAGGIPTWEEYNGIYKPESGSATYFITDNEFFLLPDESVLRIINRFIEGKQTIPTHAIGEGGGPVGSERRVQGICEFAIHPQGDVAGVQLVTTWSGMPICKIPTAIGYHDTVIA